jgi:hypothetical protein
MAAIGAEVPRVSVAFASIGLGHGVFCARSGRLLGYFRAIVENTMERREKFEKATSGNRLFVET